MPGQERSISDLIRRRVELVSEVSVHTARALKLAQAASGIEMDILRLEQAIGRSPANGQLVQELHDTVSTAVEMREAQANCAEDIAEAERTVAALDELLAAAEGSSK